MEHGYIITTRTVGREKYLTANMKFTELKPLSEEPVPNQLTFPELETEPDTEKVATYGNISEDDGTITLDNGDVLLTHREKVFVLIIVHDFFVKLYKNWGHVLAD